MYVCTYACMYICLLDFDELTEALEKIGVWYVCMYLCMYVCIYACMYDGLELWGR
jgi:hypothetical protein